MPIQTGATFALSPADNGTRVRISSLINLVPVNVEVGDSGQTWPEGCYIEIVRLPDCLASVSIIGSFGIIVNQMSGTSSLEPGEYGRVSLISPGIWDLHIYKTPSVSVSVSAPEMVVYSMNNGTGTFGGALIGNFSSVQQRSEIVSPEWTYDSYSGAFICSGTGMYEVVVEGRIVGAYSSNGPSSWPNGLSAYGVDVSTQGGAVSESFSTRAHTRYAPLDLFSGNFGLSPGSSSSEAGSAFNSVMFTERFIVKAAPTGKVIPQMFATSYNSSAATATFFMLISFKKVGEYTPL